MPSTLPWAELGSDRAWLGNHRAARAKVVAGLLAGEDKGGLTEAERAKGDRTVAQLRKMGAGEGRKRR